MSELLDFINSYEKQKITNLLKCISNDYNLDLKELTTKYLDGSESKKNSINKIQDHEQCCARKQDGMRCSRRHKPGSRYCGKHENTLKFGEFNDNNEKKNEDLTVRVVKIIINGVTYLMDNNNIVYTDDTDKPEVIGKCKKITKDDEITYELIES